MPAAPLTTAVIKDSGKTGKPADFGDPAQRIYGEISRYNPYEPENRSENLPGTVGVLTRTFGKNCPQSVLLKKKESLTFGKSKAFFASKSVCLQGKVRLTFSVSQA